MYTLTSLDATFRMIFVWGGYWCLFAGILCWTFFFRDFLFEWMCADFFWDGLLVLVDIRRIKWYKLWKTGYVRILYVVHSFSKMPLMFESYLNFDALWFDSLHMVSFHVSGLGILLLGAFRAKMHNYHLLLCHFCTCLGLIKRRDGFAVASIRGWILPLFVGGWL